MPEHATTDPRPAGPGAAAGDATIRPCQFSFPDQDLAELRRRIEATRWPERAHPDNLIHYNRLDRGGHFAAWGTAQLVAQELRAAFRSLR
jgi:hypothetical protein